jgi:hypothetical protein
VLGYNNKDEAASYNKFLKDHKDLLTGSFKDGNGVSWTINLDIQYEAGDKSDADRINAHPNGDNVITIGNDGEYAHADDSRGNEHAQFDRKDPSGPMSMIVGRYDPSDRNTVIGVGKNGKSDFSRGMVGFHETLHLLGLSDRYNTNDQHQWTGSHVGFGTDVMGVHNAYYGPLTMSQRHWDNWGSYILKSGAQSGAILNVVVDRDPSTQILK